MCLIIDYDDISLINDDVYYCEVCVIFFLEFGLLFLCNCLESFCWGDVSVNRYWVWGILFLLNICIFGVSGFVML